MNFPIRFESRGRGPGRGSFRASLLALLLALLTYPVLAQGFDSTSDGSDGALNLTTPGTVVFDPSTFSPPLDPDQDGIFHFTTINIAAGVTVQLTANKLHSRPVFWLASGAVQIDGVVQLNGEEGYDISEPSVTNIKPATPGPGGFAGGIGEHGDSPAQGGFGPGGGISGAGVSNQNGGTGAGFAVAGGATSAGPGGDAYGNTFLVPLIGGSGGGGGTYNGSGGSNVAGGGGAGGGALMIASSLSIALEGSIEARGGRGGVGSGATSIAGGGGGSGGAIHLLSPVISGSGNLNVLRGDGGFGGGAGSAGRIRIDAFEQNHAFQTFGIQAVLGTPFLILPAAHPSVRITSVAGVSVPTHPGGSFAMPDVTFMDGSAVPIEIEAENVPLGTVVKLHLFAENGPDQIVDSTPLAGTLALSTATATATIPPGFSRSFARLTFDP